MSETRYGVYYTPSSTSTLGQFGSSWLGRDCNANVDVRRLKLNGVNEAWQMEMTKVPRHYGFHGTLKAPFHTPSGVAFEVLNDAIGAFSEHHAAFEMPPLELSILDGFIALRPQKECKAINAFAANCVRAFDPFRLAPTPKEMAKRLKMKLSERQKQHLKTWGYPYVMGDFQFHMTLTDRLDPYDLDIVFTALNHHLEDVLDQQPWTFDSLTLVQQKTPKSMFEVVKRFSLSR